MPTPIPPSTSPQTPVTTNAPSVESAAPAVTPEKSAPQTPKEDPKAAAKNAEASKQQAREKKSDNVRREQLVKKELNGNWEAVGAQFAADAANAGVGTLRDAPASAAKTSKTEKATSSDKPAQQKKTDKPSEGTVWESVKGAVKYAANSLDKGRQVIDSGIAIGGAVQRTEGSAPTPEATGLNKGESISAKVTTQKDAFHFQFERPVTQDQAAAIIFQDGKVPPNAKLAQGQGNTWVVQGAGEKTASHFNAHKETQRYPERKPTDTMFPDKELTFTWTGGELRTNTGVQKRTDQKNDMGFTISNSYQLDQGQRSKDTLGLPGMGYEVSFEKPMTKAEVMNKLVDKEKITHGEVRLIPKTAEPTTQWKVEGVGIDGVSAWKDKKVFTAFADANTYGKESLPPDTPAGIKKHIDNKTVPADAANPKPGVYVWEQDGYMNYVKTNNKGKDGTYEHEMTRMPTEKQSRQWMEQYMKKEGKAPREAWMTFWQDTVDTSRGMWGMVAGAAKGPVHLRMGNPPKSSWGNEPPPSPRGMSGKVSARGGSANTIVSHPPPAPGKPGATSAKNTMVAHPPPIPEPQPAPRVVNQGQVRGAPNQVSDIGNANTQQAPDVALASTPNVSRQTLDSVGAATEGSQAPRRAGTFTVQRGNRSYTLASLPGDKKEFTIQTPAGKQKITGLEYRLRRYDAQEWATKELLNAGPKNRKWDGHSNAPTHEYTQQVNKQAQEKFKLNDRWWMSDPDDNPAIGVIYGATK